MQRISISMISWNAMSAKLLQVSPRRIGNPNMDPTRCMHPNMLSNKASETHWLTEERTAAHLANDAKVIFKCNKTADVTGVDNHELNSRPMVDATAKTITDKGPVILILGNCPCHVLNRTLHSAGQIAWFHNKVCDTSMKVGGRQVIKTVDGYCIPINVI